MIYAFFIAFAAFFVIVIRLGRPVWRNHNEEASKLTHTPYVKPKFHDKYDDEDWRLKVKTVDVTGKKREKEAEEDKDSDE